MPTDRRRRKEDQGISPFMDPAFRRSSVHFDNLEFQRRFEQNLIRYDLKSGAQVTEEITNTVILSGGGGGGGGTGCYWTKEGSNLAYYEGNVGVGIHPHDNDFEVRGNVLVEAIAEQPYVEIRNWSDTAYDPVIHWSVGATPVKKFTMGVDDSDSDAWLLCSGDILTSLVTGAIYSLTYNYSGKIAIADTSNNRVHVYTTAGVRVVSAGTGSAGSGDDEFSVPWAICNDGVHVYILETGNDRLQKRLISDLSFVAKIGSLGAGNDQFTNPRGICTDGTHLYIADMNNNRIQKRLCSDLSYVSKTSVADPTHNFNGPEAICTDGTYLYITQTSGATCRLIKLLCSTLASVMQIHDDGYLDGTTIDSICVRGGFLYIINTNNPATLLCIYKYTASALSYVDHYLAGASVIHGTPYVLRGVDTDGTNLYFGNNFGGTGDPQEVQVYTMAGAWVSEFGTYGITVDNFYTIRGVSLCGTISAGATIPYRAPILKAGLDGSYVDSYPVHRFRDQIQLMEDGVVAATKYVGLNAPGAITASYNITLPAAVPGAQAHFAISTAGVVTFGQNVGTTGSPTFVRITSLSVAIGTAPITVTSTTVCTNLNAGMVDGYHHDQSLLIAASPTFVALTLTQAIGTAPLVVTSTTLVTNLNADLLDGSHAAAFAAVGHNHSGVYEPVLGNPGTDGWVLSSTVAGVRSWIAPGGGSTTFLALTDTPANYTGAGGYFVKVNAGATALEFIASSVAAHDILSASHGDALAGVVARGSLIYGNATPKWANLPVGAAGFILTSDGTDVAWAAPGGAAHAMLSATHTDTLADTVIRGDILYGNATPKWARLAKGTSGYILTMGANDPAWAAPGYSSKLRYMISGDYHGPILPGSPEPVLANVAWTIAHSYTMAFLVTEITSFDSLHMYINAGNLAGRLCMLGLYADNGSGYPGVLLESGEVDWSTTGLKTVAFGSARVLQPGLYWLSIEANNATPTIRSFTAANVIYSIFGKTDATSTTKAGYLYLLARNYDSTMPNPFTAGAPRWGGEGGAGTSAPWVALKVT